MSEPARVLIVDGDAGTCETLGDVLGARGYTVVVAERAHAGLDRLATGPVDAAIVDIMLPDMSGLEVLEARRSPTRATGGWSGWA